MTQKDRSIIVVGPQGTVKDALVILTLRDFTQARDIDPRHLTVLTAAAEPGALETLRPYVGALVALDDATAAQKILLEMSRGQPTGYGDLLALCFFGLPSAKQDSLFQLRLLAHEVGLPVHDIVQAMAPIRPPGQRPDPVPLSAA